MTPRRGTVESIYMQWAKTRSHARFNLAVSGMPNLDLGEIDLPFGSNDITARDSYGYAPLVGAIAARYGVPTDNVVTAAGTSMANHLAMAALVEPGDEVVVERPVYEPIVAALEYLGADLHSIARRYENGYALDPAELAAAITERTRLIVVTNLHNPSSALLSQSELAELGRMASHVGARVLVDEVYLDGTIDHGARSARLLGPEFVVTSSLTKLYGLSGLRCGWILAEPDLARRMWLLNDLFGVMAAHPAEQMSVAAFPQLDTLLARAHELLETNRRAYFAFLDTRNEVDDHRLAYGNTVFPRLHVRVDELCELLRTRYETSVVPGAFFGAPEHVRIGLTADPAVFRAGIERLGDALDSLRG